MTLEDLPSPWSRLALRSPSILSTRRSPDADSVCYTRSQSGIRVSMCVCVCDGDAGVHELTKSQAIRSESDRESQFITFCSTERNPRPTFVPRSSECLLPLVYKQSGSRCPTFDSRGLQPVRYSAMKQMLNLYLMFRGISGEFHATTHAWTCDLRTGTLAGVDEG